jgi:hypothetical protein
MADWYQDYMHPYTDRATFIAYQDAAKRIHYRRSPTDQDRAMVALYEAVETKASQLESLALQVASLAAQPPVRVIRQRLT